jgi:hypothetical protein
MSYTQIEFPLVFTDAIRPITRLTGAITATIYNQSSDIYIFKVDASSLMHSVIKLTDAFASGAASQPEKCTV